MRYLTLTLATMLILFLTPLPVVASTPGTINYQGVLRDSGGVPENGTFDMKFRLFDAANAGNELVVDQHLAAGTGGVVVSGGLFSVALGSGTVTDGSGPGVLTSFVDAFAQQDAVWLEIVVGAETLAPRVSILASAYAINSRLFQGKDASQFLDTSATPQAKTGKITASGGVDFGPGATDELTAATVNTLTGGGNADSLHTHALVGQASNASLLDSIDSSQFLRSDTSDSFTSGTLTLAAGTVLSAKGEVHLDGKLFMDVDGPDATQAIYFYDQGNPLGEAFAWDETLDRFTVSNTLRLQNQSNLEITGDSVGINSDGPDGAQSIYFYDHGEPAGQSLAWDDAASRFAFSNGGRFEGALSTAGNVSVGGDNLSIGATGPDRTQIIGFYNNGGPNNAQFSWEDLADRFRLSNDLSVGGNLDLFGHTLSMGGQGIEASQTINFFEDGSFSGETFGWDNAEDRFEASDDLAISGVLRTGSTTTGPVTYNTIGSGTPTSGDMSSSSDLFVSTDLEVGDQLYLGGTEYIDNVGGLMHTSSSLHIGSAAGGILYLAGDRIYFNAGDPGGPLPVEQFLFFNGEFVVSDDLDVQGTLTANVKNFVQNHPYDESLEVVYTTLEGPEASTFTRGSARLKDGVARVALDESFKLVTHPDLGLTASLTPRGGWADLYVESISTTELVVKAAPGTAADAAFDYLVLGLRVGMEESPVVRPRRRDARLPEPETLRAAIAGRPELARFTPLARYRATDSDVFGVETTDLSRGDALRNAIGIDPQVGSSGGGPTTARSTMPAARAPERGATKGEQAPASPSRTPADGRSDEDEQANLDARSLRPNSGGLEAVSPAVGEVEEGDVMILDRSGAGVRRSNSAADPTVVGIATAASRVGADGTSAVPFAVAGVVTCKVDATHGAILAGDLLVTSTTPGHAMRASAPGSGTVIGKALETLSSGTGTIRVLVTLR